MRTRFIGEFMDLLIYCAGGLGKEVFELADSVNKSQKRWKNIFFVDDMIEKEKIKRTVVYRYNELSIFFEKKDVQFIIATGEPAFRSQLFEKVKQDGYSLATLVAEKAIIHGGATVGEGCVIRDDCQISADVTIGEDVYIQGAVHVGHDSCIGAHTVLSSMVNISGKVNIGIRTYIAPGCLIKDRISIGNDVIAGIGSVILRNIKDEKIVLGYPAKVIGENESKKVFHIF